MPRPVSTALARWIAVLAVGMSAGAFAPAAAAVVIPPPDSDPFYAVPAHLAHLPNGTLLAARPEQAMALAVPIPARAWQLKYKTIDQLGKASAYVTTLLVPRTPWRGDGPRLGGVARIHLRHVTSWHRSRTCAGSWPGTARNTGLCHVITSQVGEHIV